MLRTRERIILATMAVMILFMGMASPLFTKRMAASTDNLLRQMERPQNALAPRLNSASGAAFRVALPAPQPNPAPVIFAERQARHDLRRADHQPYRLAPELVLCIFGIIVMFVDPFVKPSGRKALGWLSFFGALVALASVVSWPRIPAPPTAI